MHISRIEWILMIHERPGLAQELANYIDEINYGMYKVATDTEFQEEECSRLILEELWRESNLKRKREEENFNKRNGFGRNQEQCIQMLKKCKLTN